MSSDNEAKLMVSSAVGFVFGLSSFFKGFKTWRLKRLMENTPTSKVRSIAMGLVEVYGEAFPAVKILQSPFSQTDCLYFYYKIEEYRSSGKSSHWVTVKEETQRTLFYLRDETGEVLVDTNGANIDIPGVPISEATPQIRNFLSREGIAHEGWFGLNKKMRFTEAIITPHDQLYILGTAGLSPHVDDITTQDSAGRTMIHKGDNNQNYYIANRSESKIENEKTSGALWQIYGGGAVALICLAVFLFTLKIL